MTEPQSTVFHGAAGEHLVLGELLRRGLEAYLAHQGQQGWDILVCLADGQRKRIQVKTINWPHRKAVQVNQKMKFDFLVVVLLNKANARSRYLVLRRCEVERRLSPENPNRKGADRTFNVPNDLNSGGLAENEDAWSVFYPR